MGLSSGSTPAGLCLLLTAVYVLALYIGGNPRLGRDEPTVIRRRAVNTALVAATAWVPVKLTYPDDDWSQLRHKLGLRRVGAFRAAVTALELCTCLFAGPLVMALVDYPHTSRWPMRSRAAWWRNIVVAPLTEEFFFRACMCPLLLSGGWTTRQVIAICPLFFGIAHVHHVWELRSNRGMPWRAAFMQVGFQVMYTTVFGTFATYLLLRTGNLAAPVAAHMFCNSQGMPNFQRMLAHGPVVRAALGGGIAIFVALLVSANSAD